MMTKTYTLAEISVKINGRLLGDGTTPIHSPEQISKATQGQITFIGNQKFARKWSNSTASAAIVREGIHLESKENSSLIYVADPDIAIAIVLGMFAPDLPLVDGISPNSHIESSAKIGESVSIGAGSYIGKNVTIEKNTVIYPNVTIMDDVVIGHHTIIWSGTVIRERCSIGSHCILHNNVSIGADGFGYIPSPDGAGLLKVPQIGDVVIGNGVEIGANSCIDRGKFSSTILGDGCKIDNLVQIGHNCVLGRCCIMAGNSGLAGTVTLGDGVMIGGSASIKDHVTIGSGAKVGAGSGVIGDIAAGKTVLGYPAQDSRLMLRQWAALKQLVK